MAMCSSDDCWKGLSREKPYRQSDPCSRSTDAEQYVTADDHSDANNNAGGIKAPASESLESPKKILDRGPSYLRQRIFNRDSGF